MKKTLTLLCSFLAFSFSLSAQTKDDIERKFVCGNIREKIEAVQEADEENALKIAGLALDYSLSAVDIIGQDPALSALAQSALLASAKVDGAEVLSDKMLLVFNHFDDESVKVTAVETLSNFETAKTNGTTEILNGYIEERYKENHPGNMLIGSIIITLGKIGDEHSFTLIYNIWLNSLWTEYKETVENSLKSLCEAFPSEVNKVVFFSDNSVILRFLELVIKSNENKNNLKENLAQNALSYAIYNVESKQEFSKEFFLIQKEALKTLSSAKWSSAEEVVLKNFAIAKKEHEMKIISDKDFAEIITLTSSFSTAKTASAFSALLGEYNSKAVTSALPSEEVMLALIKSLGELGDKAAFDNLLYVTYLNYSPDVIEEAKNSLAKLQW